MVLNLNKDAIALMDAIDLGRVILNDSGQIMRLANGNGLQQRCDQKVKKLIAAGYVTRAEGNNTYALTTQGEEARDAARAQYTARQIRPSA